MLVEFAEHVENDTFHSMEKTVKKISVKEKILTEFFWNRKDTVPVIAVSEF